MFPENEILKILKDNFEEETIKTIDGMLLLQIIVDLEGNSCLLSLQNETNISSDKLNLKSIIDENLKWKIPLEKKAALVAIKFSDIVELKRFGINSKKGIHELEE